MLVGPATSTGCTAKPYLSLCEGRTGYHPTNSLEPQRSPQVIPGKLFTLFKLGSCSTSTQICTKLSMPASTHFAKSGSPLYTHLHAFSQATGTYYMADSAHSHKLQEPAVWAILGPFARTVVWPFFGLSLPSAQICTANFPVFYVSCTFCLLLVFLAQGHAAKSRYTQGKHWESKNACSWAEILVGWI